MQRLIAGWRLTAMDGTVYEPGDLVPAGAFMGVSEAALIGNGGLRLERAVLATTPAADEPPVGAFPADEPWPMKTSPEAYLKRHPDGDHAGLARRHLGQSG